ncbi:hypothetical protein [Leifsonia shinshuensis]|uniref:Peptidoglycan hydrolase-like protein with peptidoglycan-binding domain n=1 Tax=Leifsonia shinshuensis TaxID=150026 RepID=A0A853D319_9MICO|nr:hypothetical protein [Leifsonia shinshuensis]NYJ25784.1 peptidoglycan hydrolase-like protein with peptidoglycan-binding domain [Leifsonia shinshuensis]
MAEQIAPQVRVPRFPKPITTVVVLLLIIAAAGGGLAIGYRMQSDVAASIQQAQTPVETTALVESKAYSLPPIVGTVGAINSFDYATTINPAVVTRLGVAPGEAVKSGSLLVSINDSPVFALRLAIRPWRDLAVGDRGTDIASLNDELNALGLRKGAASDTYNDATRDAVQKMFKQAKLDAPGTPAGASLPLANIAVLPQGDYIVKSSVARGSAAGEGPVVHAVQAASQVVTVLDVVHAQSARAGSKVDLTMSGGAHLGAGSIARVGEFRAGDPKASGLDAQSGYPATITFDKQPEASLAGDEQVQITFPSDTAAQSSVPTIAIHQAGNRTWVVVKQDGKKTNVDVKPEWQQGGWTGVAAGSNLSPGTVIVLSGAVNDNH